MEMFCSSPSTDTASEKEVPEEEHIEEEKEKEKEKEGFNPHRMKAMTVHRPDSTLEIMREWEEDGFEADKENFKSSWRKRKGEKNSFSTSYNIHRKVTILQFFFFTSRLNDYKQCIFA